MVGGLFSRDTIEVVMLLPMILLIVGGGSLLLGWIIIKMLKNKGL